MSRAPVHEIEVGRIKASICLNETSQRAQHSVQIVRLSIDGERSKQSESFEQDDLPALARASDLAHAWILQHSAERVSTVAGPDDEQEIRRRYLEQQKRMSCPGCGEDPFVG